VQIFLSFFFFFLFIYFFGGTALPQRHLSWLLFCLEKKHRKTQEIGILCSPGSKYSFLFFLFFFPVFGCLPISVAFQIRIHEDPLKILFLKSLRHILTHGYETLRGSHGGLSGGTGSPSTEEGASESSSGRPKGLD